MRFFLILMMVLISTNLSAMTKKGLSDQNSGRRSISPSVSRTRRAANSVPQQNVETPIPGMPSAAALQGMTTSLSDLIKDESRVRHSIGSDQEQNLRRIAQQTAQNALNIHHRNLRTHCQDEEACTRGDIFQEATQSIAQAHKQYSEERAFMKACLKTRFLPYKERLDFLFNLFDATKKLFFLETLTRSLCMSKLPSEL